MGTIKDRLIRLRDKLFPKEDTTAGDGATIAASEMRFDVIDARVAREHADAERA